MIKASAALAVLLLATSAFAQGSIWFEGSIDEAKALAQADGKLILIGFVSDY